MGAAVFWVDTTLTPGLLKKRNEANSGWDLVGVMVTTKGDLMSFSTVPVVVPVSGTNGRVLTEDSTQAAGIKWATPASGAVSLLGSSVVAGSVAASIVVSSIAGTANHLKIIAVGRLDTGSAGSVTWAMRFNGDTGANYNWNANAPTSTAFDGGAVAGDTSLNLRYIAGSGDTAGDATILELSVPLYAGTTFRKSISGTGQMSYLDTATGTRWVVIGGIWKSTAAITSVTLIPSSGNFIIGSALYVYGLT